MSATKMIISLLEDQILHKRVEYLKRLKAGATHDELRKIFCEMKELEGKVASTKNLNSLNNQNFSNS
jgi:hypothetical protein